MFKDDIKIWLNFYKQPQIKPTTFCTLVRNLNYYVLPYLSDKNTNEITSDDIMRILYDLKYKRNLSYSIQKKAYNIMCEFFRYAYNRDLINRELTKNISLPNVGKTQERIPPRALTTDEIALLYQTSLVLNNKGNFNYQYGPAMIIYLNTGMRLGELCGLKLNDYDPFTGNIHIHGNLERIAIYNDDTMEITGGKTLYQNSPKSYESNRHIKANNMARKYMNYYYNRAKKLNSEFLLCNDKGEMVSPNVIQHSYYRIVKKAGIEQAKGIHTLRHTCATHLIRNGADIKVVSKILGHSSTQITYDTYVHLFEDDIPEALSILDEAFKAS